MARTNKDILMTILEEMVGPEMVPIMLTALEQQFAGMIPEEKMNQEISEEDFQKAVEAIRKEGPGLLEKLQKGEMPDLPFDLGSQN